ncbi:recombinase family protein [Ancylobacter sp. IITR112]|uniref:recombinase family protein n=1 Tax=Ancylobacter sp. IITR112 TaxID=3138073 RepID=UPI00352A9460
MAAVFGYARVSKDDPTLDAQRLTLRAAGAVYIFEETVGAPRADRLRLWMAIRRLEPGDVLLVTRLDHLARSTRDLLKNLAAIGERGALFRSLEDSWADTTAPHGQMLRTVLAGLADFERELLRARTGQGRERARAQGVKMGRKPKLTGRQKVDALIRRDFGEEPLSEIARSYNVSRSTISRLRPADGAPYAPREVAWSTALEAVAAYGSVSYGILPAARLKAVMLGEVPSDAESAQVHQALTETLTYRLLEMGREIGLDGHGFRERYSQLVGRPLPME